MAPTGSGRSAACDVMGCAPGFRRAAGNSRPVVCRTSIDTPVYRYASRIGTLAYRYALVPITAPPSSKGPGDECPHRACAAGSDAIARPPLVRELLLVAGLFLVYKFGRQLATGHTGEAFRNAHRVWDFERAVHLPGEGSVQSLLLHGDGLVHVANTYYAAVHFPATVAFLVWLYLRRPAHYVLGPPGPRRRHRRRPGAAPAVPARPAAHAGGDRSGRHGTCVRPLGVRERPRPTPCRTSSRRCRRCTSAGP